MCVGGDQRTTQQHGFSFGRDEYQMGLVTHCTLTMRCALCTRAGAVLGCGWVVMSVAAVPWYHRHSSPELRLSLQHKGDGVCGDLCVYCNGQHTFGVVILLCIALRCVKRQVGRRLRFHYYWVGAS